MSAYACRPGAGSEPGVGWNWAVQASRDNEVWVITPSRFQSTIEAELERSPNPNLHFVYHSLPRPWSVLFKHRNRFGYLHYYAWQASALAVARKLNAEVGFDLAHHITYAGFRFPSFLLALGIPYVWGPLGGGAQAPLRFIKTFGFTGAVEQLARVFSNVFTKLDPLLWLTAHRASLIIADSPETAKALPIGSAGKIVLESQDALYADEVPLHKDSESAGLRAAYLGRLLYWKGVHLAIEAVAEARKTRNDITLTLIPTGGGEEKFRSLAESLGVADAVEIAVAMPRKEALELLAEHDCLLFPSFQDSGGPFAVLEAMAAGLPVVCLNIGGPALTVTPEIGFRVEVGSRSEVIKGLARALVKLAEDQILRRSMGNAARQRLQEEFLWDRKAGVINSLYARALHLPAMQLSSVEGSS